MVSDPIRNLIIRINQTNSPLRRMKLGLKFFTKPSNYQREAIGWGEDYAYIDDGREVARAALKKAPKKRKS